MEKNHFGNEVVDEFETWRGKVGPGQEEPKMSKFSNL